MEQNQWQQLDHQFIWHPCSQMKDYEQFKPLMIASAKGDYLELTDGRKIIDAISSWWCKSLGHNHPRLKAALYEQAERFEHVILANTTNETIVRLSEKLSKLMFGLNKVFYASDGSSAIEIAMKMSLHSRVISGDTQRKNFLALQNGYHGETIGALSVSDVDLYRKPYQDILFNPYFIANIPYVFTTLDPLWQDCSTYWPDVEKALAPYANITTALILEPILQGAGGMKIYSQDFLRRLSQWCKLNRIHLIADEIMTGVGRTGKMLACEHASIQPDFLCLSKGLTSGWLPLSAVITTDEIYSMFYDDYATGKAFLHSHTYSGNALAARIALETLTIIEEENLCQRAKDLNHLLLTSMQEVAEVTRKLENVRGIGAVVAADLITHDSSRRLGFEVYQAAVKSGALLRPLGNTIYWLLPLNMNLHTIAKLKDITITAIKSVNF